MILGWIASIFFLLMMIQQQVVAFTQQSTQAQVQTPTASARTQPPVRPMAESSTSAPPVCPKGVTPSQVVWDAILAHWPDNQTKAYCVTECESDFTVHIKTNPTYRGMFQFDRETWATVGGSGDPADASAYEQSMRARMLYEMRGWQPWPRCGSR